MRGASQRPSVRHVRLKAPALWRRQWIWCRSRWNDEL